MSPIIDGVEDVVSGYAGGTTLNPTYQDICTGLTGHAEVIKMFKLENDFVNTYVKRDAERLTMQDIKTFGAVILGKLRVETAREVLLTDLADPSEVQPPAPLAAKEPGHQDWFGWANAVSSTPLSSAPASAPRRGSAPHPRAAAGLAPP